jgi:peptidoglycan/xylan/chitin deacetylase (PgdA/CDA1 family)
VVTLKRHIKRALQGVVARAAPFAWRRRRDSLLILMYHRVLPADHPDRATEQPGMYVSPETLRMHLAALKQNFTLLHLDDWLAAVAAGRPVPRNACAITFDDGWKDNFDFAFPVLTEAQAPATIFLVSELVGTKYSFWPNTLARLLLAGSDADFAKLPDWLRQSVQARRGAAGVFPAGQVDALIEECKGRANDAQMHAALRDVMDSSAAPAQRDLMSWDEIRAMQSGGLVRFGSHTRRHIRLLASIDQDTLTDEVVGSRGEIARSLGSEPQTFCYPNGDLSPAALERVRASYRGAVTTRHGWNSRESDHCLLQRVGVHEDVSCTRASFLSRLAGVG